jgi:multiple sugar transport system permease protein
MANGFGKVRIMSRKRILRKKQKDILFLLTFLAPFFVIMIIFKVVPIGANIVYSLQKTHLNKPGEWIGLKNYVKLFHDELFWKAMKNTLLYLAYVGPVNVIGGFLFAMLLNAKQRGRTAVRAIIFMPYVLMTTVVGITWRWILDGNNGLLNYYLNKIGIEPIFWLSNTKTAMLGIALASIWWTIGYNTVIYLAALQDISTDVVEASIIDGANGLQRVFHISIPLVKGTTFFVVLTTVINSMEMFSQVYVMTSGGPSYSTLTLVQYLYTKAFRETNVGYSSSVGVMLFIIILLMSVVVFLLLSGDNTAEKTGRRKGGGHGGKKERRKAA